jgi:hypothetical protein
VTLLANPRSIRYFWAAEQKAMTGAVGELGILSGAALDRHENRFIGLPPLPPSRSLSV